MIPSFDSRFWNLLILTVAFTLGNIAIPQPRSAFAQKATPFLKHLISTRELSEAGATSIRNIQWSPDGTKMLLWSERGGTSNEYLRYTAVVDTRSGKFAAYLDKKAMQKVVSNHPEMESGSRVLIAETPKFNSFTLGNRGLLCISYLDGYQRISNRDFRLQRQTDLRSDRRQRMKIIARRGTNAIIECKKNKSYPWELLLYSVDDGRLMPVMQSYENVQQDKHNFYLPANSKSLVASYVAATNAFSFLPRSAAQRNTKLEAGTRVVNAVFCNQDQWLCCLTTTDSKSYRLEFFEVETGKKVQQILTPADQVSDSWRSLQSSIDGKKIFIAEDKLLLEWAGERFEKLADVTTYGIREMFRDHYVGACSMDPTGKKIALRLRGEDDKSDDFWLLDTEAFGSAKQNLDVAKEATQQQASNRQLSDRPVVEIAFDQKKLYHPKNLLLRWDPTEQQRYSAEQVAFSANDRWIVAQLDNRTHLYDLWTDNAHNLNQLAWDQHRIGSVYGGDVRIAASEHFAVSSEGNRLLMTGGRHAWIWDLDNLSPSLIQHAAVDRRAESEWEETLKKDLDNADHVRILKPLSGAVERLLVSTGGRMAMIGMRDNQFVDLGSVSVSHRIFSLSEDDQQLAVLNSNVTTSTESELRIYSLSPKFEGKSLQALPRTIEALSSPYSGAFLLDGHEDVDDLVAGKQNSSPTDYRTLGFRASRLYHQPATSEWIAVDRDPPKDSVRIHRLGKDFSRLGTITVARLENRYIKGIAQTSDSEHLAISYSHDDAVWLLKANWK